MSSMQALATLSLAAFRSRVRRFASRQSTSRYEHRETLLEDQLGRGDACARVGQCLDHAVKAQTAQLSDGVFVEQGRSPRGGGGDPGSRDQG
jgi:predicted transcriptional regulator